jgi:hypothetical protein
VVDLWTDNHQRLILLKSNASGETHHHAGALRLVGTNYLFDRTISPEAPRVAASLKQIINPLGDVLGDCKT